MLTEIHKTSRKFLSQYHTDGEEFLNRILTGDETWVAHFNVETKQLPMQRYPCGKNEFCRQSLLPSMNLKKKDYDNSRRCEQGKQIGDFIAQETNLVKMIPRRNRPEVSGIDLFRYYMRLYKGQRSSEESQLGSHRICLSIDCDKTEILYLAEFLLAELS
ncbi:hypothetical protein TNCV_5050131 [Trichonephila clavipes]|nr:hypothetical protein TNCV_5050131 [Trichonephila clavipes]